jgi:FKBP-type peptidyl-prolyl cis-trans isomerase
MKWTVTSTIAFMVYLLLILGCGKSDNQPEGKTEMAESTQSSQNGPAHVNDADYQTTESGLKYAILKKSDGEKPKSGQTVAVHYSGWLPDGKNFDSSYKRNKPFEFVLGARQVIPGWDEGIALLHKGEKAQLVIPPELGYGQRGIPGVIPENATLIFDVELVDIK